MIIQELRIGNYIQSNYGESKGQSIKVSFDLMITLLHTGIDQLEPIPLTEQWLKDFGFEVGYDDRKTDKHLGVREYKKDGLSIHFMSSGSIFAYWLEEDILSFKAEAHTLQNLYFALTGKELEKIKETA